MNSQGKEISTVLNVIFVWILCDGNIYRYPLWMFVHFCLIVKFRMIMLMEIRCNQTLVHAYLISSWKQKKKRNSHFQRILFFTVFYEYISNWETLIVISTHIYGVCRGKKFSFHLSIAETTVEPNRQGARWKSEATTTTMTTTTMKTMMISSVISFAARI